VVTYAYDLNGRVTGVNDNSASLVAASPPGGTSTVYTTSYGYDALNRVTGVSWDNAALQTAPTAGNVSFTHTYDATDRRIAQSATDNSWMYYPASVSSSTSYTSNALNQYSAVGAVTPTYDANGNLTYDGTFTYAYDAENRLTSIQQGATTVATYAYDAQGRRKSKTVGGTTTV